MAERNSQLMAERNSQLMAEYEFTRTQKFSNLTIFGRTDLRISLSGAKFDEEADFDVRPAGGPPKPHQIDENLTFPSENLAKKIFGVEKSKVANRLKRALPKFRGDRSEVQGVNGRSKFAVAAGNFSVVLPPC